MKSKRARQTAEGSRGLFPQEHPAQPEATGRPRGGARGAPLGLVSASQEWVEDKHQEFVRGPGSHVGINMMANK